MSFDPKQAADFLGDLAGRIETPHDGWPASAPSQEFMRSPAAARVGELAARDGLFLFHFEHRAMLDLPEDWVPADRADLAQPPQWAAGVLPEPKYQSFRHDLPLGSYHPWHRAKWSTHELCHGLVGFGWRPSASRFFHATAARLAELLPVVLWYFLDEAYLVRCPDHQGPTFRDLCPQCEACAAATVEDPEALAKLSQGRAFLDRELAAIARSRRLGRPVPHQWATLNLCTDGIAYADAHAARLDSDAFLSFAARFLVADGGWSPTLDDLEGRVEAVAKALVGQEALQPLAPSPIHGRWRWMLQDVAWRLLVVAHESEGPVAQELDAMVDRLAQACDLTRGKVYGPDAAVLVDAMCADALRGVIRSYDELAREYYVPEPEDLFAVGYPLLDDFGTARTSLLRGLATVVPKTLRALGEDARQVFVHFVREDAWVREPLADRFAAFLARRVPGPLADLARFEALTSRVPVGDQGVTEALGLGGATDRLRLAPAARLERFRSDVVALGEALDGGDPQVLRHQSWDRDVALVFVREGDEVGVIDIAVEAADAIEALGDGGVPDLASEEVGALLEVGVLAPAAWGETR